MTWATVKIDGYLVSDTLNEAGKLCACMPEPSGLALKFRDKPDFREGWWLCPYG